MTGSARGDRERHPRMPLEWAGRKVSPSSEGLDGTHGQKVPLEKEARVLQESTVGAAGSSGIDSRIVSKNLMSSTSPVRTTTWALGRSST